MRILGFLKHIKPYRIWTLKQMLVVVEGFIEDDRRLDAYLCHQFWGGKFWFLPDWKAFPEIKKYANHDNPLIHRHSELTCRNVWFEGNEERRDFLKQCINE